jgi:hypothetical protein
MENLQFPIGRFKPKEIYTFEEIQEGMLVIKNLYEGLRKIVSELDLQQINSPYRPNGWTGAQVIHHLADSHINCYCRFKLALTEDNPTIKPYMEDKWAMTQDNESTSYEVSMELIKNLHIKWSNLMKAMSESDFKRTFYHPESERTIPLSEISMFYAWHSSHHLAHLELLKNV